MKRIGFSSWIVVVVAGVAIGGPGATTFGAQAQAPEALPRFEVASVKENRSGESRARMQTAPGGRFVATNAPLKLMIADAFLGPQPLAASRVFGGPEWIESARYDIDAKASTEFQPSPGAPPPARQPNEPPPCEAMRGPARVLAGGIPMPQFATMLTMALADANGPGVRELGRPVIDKTGLTGRFAFTLAWTPERMPDAAPPPGVPPIDPNGPSFFTALQEQLGLRLQPATGPVEVVVIDSVDRPTPD